MKKKKMSDDTVTTLSVLGVLAAFFVFAYLSFVFHTDTSKFKLPDANSMTTVAMDVQTRTSSYKELEKCVALDIRDTAFKGGRETEVYVGGFDAEAVKEIQRQLAFHGYRSKLTSPLSGTNDFLTIVW